MLLGRFLFHNQIFYASVEVKDRIVCELNDINGKKTGRSFSLDDIQILPPCTPSKIVCVGLNYRDHAEELNMSIPGEPVLFLKPPTTVIPHGGSIIYPNASKRVDYEAELAVIMGKTASHIAAKEAREYILGYSCSNDITARDLQQKDGQWTRAKSFDTFLPLGPYINTEINPAGLDISLSVNGEKRQISNTRNLIFSVNELVSFISHIMTLLPGDVILTGTPAGVGPLKIGDRVTVTIEEIGDLENRVIA